ncbi:MAG: hypothetical protein ABIZ91_14035, partial [Gemmatimonadaceae bacterium]
MSILRRAVGATLALAGVLLAGCSSDSTTSPSIPNPILGFNVTAQSSSAVQYSFRSGAGDASYTVEQAEGSSGAFTADTVIAAPATPSNVAVTRGGLKVNTLYRFRVITTRGSQQSVPSSEASATTLLPGNA